MSETVSAELLTRLADALDDLNQILRSMAPVSVEIVSTDRDVDLTPPRPYHPREEVAAEVEAMLPTTAERMAEGMGITVHGLYRSLSRAGRLDLWNRLGREYVR